jgi:hypothetical protein
MSRFKKGTSGNPGGRPKGNPNIAALALKNSERAIATIIKIMDDEKASSNTRLAAAVHILDRAIGKPVQQVDNNPHLSGGLSHESWIDKLDAEEVRQRAAKLGIIAASEH